MSKKTAYSDSLRKMKQTLQAQALLERIGEEIVLPRFAANYEASGLKRGSGTLKTAVSKRGAKGNVFEVRGNTGTFGVDVKVLPYARFVLEGRKGFGPKNKKALRFYDSAGKPVFAKHVKAAPAHDLIHLTPADVEKAQRMVSEEMGKEFGVRIK